MNNEFDLELFRKEFLAEGVGWGVSDVYKTYKDEFLRRDAQDAYEGAKWAWYKQQEKVEDLQKDLVDAADGQMKLYEEIQNLQKQLIDQGQRFNEQSQKVKDLEYKLEVQSKLAQRAIDEAHKASRIELSIADKLKSESSPESLDSERSANAKLTEEVLRLEKELEEKSHIPEGCIFIRKEMSDDLASYFYYCGYAWGDFENTKDYFSKIYDVIVRIEGNRRES